MLYKYACLSVSLTNLHVSYAFVLRIEIVHTYSKRTLRVIIYSRAHRNATSNIKIDN